MNILTHKDLTKVFQVTILLVGLLLALGVFHTNRLISARFDSSVTTLDSLLPSKSSNR